MKTFYLYETSRHFYLTDHIVNLMEPDLIFESAQAAFDYTQVYDKPVIFDLDPNR